MHLVLVKEGNRYRPQSEMDAKDVAEMLFAEDFDVAEIPKKVELWGALLNPEPLQR
ncbi:MAG TPA: hypothetical protein VKX17_16015 [Planctomycetota bacterium]|nr:hypothetical protein [Planctomycetota bacterium]